MQQLAGLYGKMPDGLPLWKKTIEEMEVTEDQYSKAVERASEVMMFFTSTRPSRAVSGTHSPDSLERANSIQQLRQFMSKTGLGKRPSAVDLPQRTTEPVHESETHVVDTESKTDSRTPTVTASSPRALQPVDLDLHQQQRGTIDLHDSVQFDAHAEHASQHLQASALTAIQDNAVNGAEQKHLSDDSESDSGDIDSESAHSTVWQRSATPLDTISCGSSDRRFSSARSRHVS